MPLLSTPVFPLSANDSCKQALVWSWSVAGGLVRLELSAVKHSSSGPSRHSGCVFMWPLGVLGSSACVCVRAHQTRTPQADSKTHSDSVKGSRPSADSWSTLPIRSSVLTALSAPSPPELLKITCNSDVYLLLPLKNSAWFWRLSSRGLVFDLCVFLG